MAEKRLIDANALRQEVERIFLKHFAKSREPFVQDTFKAMFKRIDNAPTVNAVEAEQYKELAEMYHELRENFVDYVCLGVPNVAPYCVNRCEECVDGRGWCKRDSDKCYGFCPAYIIVDGERKDA